MKTRITLKVIGLVLFALLVFITFAAYSYVKNQLADDVADSAVKEAKSFSLSDWLMSFLGMSTAPDGGARRTLWDMISDWTSKDSYTIKGLSGRTYKVYSTTGKFIV